MSYEPTNWKTGDVVTSSKLNKLEQGVAGACGVLIVHVDENDTLDKTWLECKDAIVAGVPVVLVVELNEDGTLFYQQISLNMATQAESVYTLGVSDGSLIMVTDSENGYPVKQK